MERIDTLVIGAGQAGLAVSYYLTRAGRDHLVLEKNRVAKAWRDERWDSFTLVTPNWMLRLPGMEYAGDDPDGFLRGEEVVEYVLRFARSFDPPVIEGVEVTSVETAPGSDGLLIRTVKGQYQASNVVVATGTYQGPRIPPLADRLATDVYQVHSSGYRNPERLPPGPVLVVGSGQSGAQIAEELLEHGRDVYLSTGRAGRGPRRYRGKDAARWAQLMGSLDRTVDELPSPAHRFTADSHVSGKAGGRTLNLHRFSRDGMKLLGHLRDGDGKRLVIAPDLRENLAAADRAAREFKHAVDEFIEKQGLDAPEEDEPELRDGYEAPIITELDLHSAGVSTIVWATGYTFDFSWVRFPVFDDFGYPIQRRGVTGQPGLYFLGLLWLHTAKSGLLAGVGEDAAHVAEQIESRA